MAVSLEKVQKVRADFPIFEREVRNGKKLCYLDSGATTLKPQVVCDRVQAHYLDEASNVHRGVHLQSLSEHLFE